MTRETKSRMKPASLHAVCNLYAVEAIGVKRKPPDCESPLMRPRHRQLLTGGFDWGAICEAAILASVAAAGSLNAISSGNGPDAGRRSRSSRI
jgi:hypothetical protein